uniref:WRKY transcription factor WRKY51 n=1 Tax=Oryza punctata TaxID=4537 RepID=A0A0E0LBZ9_ORYPU
MDGDAWWYGGGGGDNWDLGAVVRFGCGGGWVSPAAAPTTTLLGEAWEYDPFSSFLVPPMTTQQALPAWGDDAAWMMAPPPGLQTGGWGEAAAADPMVVDELSGAFVVAPPPLKQQEVLEVQQPAAAEVTPPPPPNMTQADKTQPTTDQQGSGGGDGEGARGGGSRTSARRKKKQTAKEVVRVAASGPAPDSWAWRKYGQKPIKGSPYPRGYYRCSSNKTCAARKQVERCRVDPSFLLLTYTGAHTGHDVPLHRNSLAGTTRHKPPPLPSASAEAGTTNKSPATASSSHSQSPGQSASPGLSPTTPLLASSMELQGEDDAELQVEDMAIDDDDDEDGDETINTVPWGTPISDEVIAASYEWR